MRNLIFATEVQIIPNIVFLFFFLMFMMDIENYFQTKFTANFIPHLVLTTYLTIAKNLFINLYNEMIEWMEIAF